MARFKLRDLLVAVFLIAVLSAVLVPLIQRAREESRRMTCSNNFKQIGLAVYNYHAMWGQLPKAMGGTDGNDHRLSGLVAMIPFIEANSFWEQVSNPIIVEGVEFPAMGPPPDDKRYPPWQQSVPMYRCPTSASLHSGSSLGFEKTNYTFCIGDSVKNIHDHKPLNQVRGMFSPRVVTTFADVTDGLSNTIMGGEIANAQGRRRRGQFIVDAPSSILDRPTDCLRTVDPKSPSYYLPDEKLSDLGRGGNWVDGAAGHSLVQTILPPNDPSCAISVTPSDGLFSAGSYHIGGGYVLMGDGAVQFINDSIDTGDLSAVPPATVATADGIPIESPYGIWGALGTRNSTEGDVGFDPNFD